MLYEVSLRAVFKVTSKSKFCMLTLASTSKSTSKSLPTTDMFIFAVTFSAPIKAFRSLFMFESSEASTLLPGKVGVKETSPNSII